MKTKTIKSLDELGAILCAPLIRFPKKELTSGKVLIIQLWSVGETILTLPAIKAAKNKYGKIDVLCTNNNNDVFESVDFIDNLFILKDFSKDIIKFMTRNFRKYDLVYDFEEYLNISALIAFFVGKYSVGFTADLPKERDHTYNRTVRYNDCQHVVQTFCDQLGVEAPKELIPLKGESSDFMEKNGIKEFIGLCVTSSGTSANNRRWPHFKELIEKIKEDIIIIAGPDEDVKEFLVRPRVFIPNLTLKQKFELISKAKLFISNDTGPMHIAAAMGVKTIGLFGPNIPLRFGPYGKNNVALYNHKSCSPCINVHARKTPECSNAKCMSSISVGEVLAHVYPYTIS